MTVDLSDDLFLAWQADADFTAYCQQTGRGSPLRAENVYPETMDAIWAFCRDAKFHLDGHMAAMPNLPLKVGIVDGYRFRATADIWNGIGMICVDLGVIAMIHNLFNGIIFNHDSFPGTGFVEPTEARFRLTLDRLEEVLFMQGYILSYIQDEQRFKLAYTFASTCLCFVLYHEIAHIRNGHVDLIKATSPLSALEEFGQLPTAGVTAFDRRVMEWDADRVGYIISADFGTNRLLGGRYPDFPVEQRKVAFLLLQSAYALLFELMSNVEARQKPLAQRFHPPARERLLWLVTKAVDVAELMGFEVSTEDRVAAFLLGHTAWALAFDPTAPSEVETIEIDDPLAFMQHWNVLRSRLTPLNRGSMELAPVFIVDEVAT